LREIEILINKTKIWIINEKGLLGILN
jgi:hypothetical protein